MIAKQGLEDLGEKFEILELKDKRENSNIYLSKQDFLTETLEIKK